MANLSKFRIDQAVQVFKNDTEFQKILSEEKISISESEYIQIATLLLSNSEIISENTIDELNGMVPSFLRSDIAVIIEEPFLTATLYKQLMYSYKYSTIKSFFKENYHRFMPEYDFLNIQSKERLRIFQEAFMQEFDRFASIIDDIYNIVDIDKTPEKYLNYLAQIIGYERQDREILGDVSFRELIKNMVEVYKIKGTNFSFELFFNFLGFEVELKEFWFDRRFGDSSISANEYTKASNRDDFLFYLSPIKPTEYIPSGMQDPYSVREGDIIETLDLNLFNSLANIDYSPAQLIGIISGYPNTPYTFFKTNVIEYSLTAIQGSSEINEDSEEQALSEEQQESIRKYVNFLSPIFIQRNILVNIPPYEEKMESIVLSDSSRPDPRSQHPLNTDNDNSTFINDESMFHFYSGRQPANYYWDDGTRFYDDLIPALDINTERWTIKDPDYGPSYIEPGGYHIGGIYNDDFEGNIYDRNDPSLDSIYYQIKEEYPTWTEQEILEEISRLISTGDIFAYYKNWHIIKKANPTLDEAQIKAELDARIGDKTIFPLKNIFPREVMYPLIDFQDVEERQYDIVSNFSIGTPQKLSYSMNSLRALLEEGNKRKVNHQAEPLEYKDLHNKADIIKIVANSKYSAQNLSSGLRVCFPVDENYGRSAFDISGNKNDGIMHDTLFANIEGELAIHFDGSGYISIPSYSKNPEKEALSFSVWVRTEVIPSSSTVIVSKSLYSASIINTNTNGIHLVINNDGTVTSRIGVGVSPLNIKSSAVIADDKWHNIVVTLSGSLMSMYIDNVQSGAAISYTFSISNNAPWSLGACFDPSSTTTISRNFEGYIKNFAIWEKQLDTSMISSIYANELLEPTSQLIVKDDERSFANVEMTSEIPNTNFVADFENDSNVLTNVEYNYSLAPIWKQGQHEVGDLIRDNQNPNNVYICVVTYNSEEDGNNNWGDQGTNWRVFRGTSTLKRGLKINSPSFIFGAEIVDIDLLNKKVYLSKKSNITIADQKISLVNNFSGFIDLKGFSRKYDNKPARVISKTSDTVAINPQNINPTFKTTTTFTLGKPLQNTTDDGKGFINGYFEPATLRKYRYPFLWNYFELITKEYDFDKYYPRRGFGGMVLSGSAITNWFIKFFKTGTGGITLSGTAESLFRERFAYIADGGILTRGAALINIIRRYLGSGGITTSGTAPYKAKFIFLPKGSIYTSGTANYVVSLAYRFVGSGGIKMIGDAVEGITAYRFVGLGSISTSGSAETSMSYTYESAGGMVLSGSARIILDAIRIRGTAPHSFTYNYSGDGGIKVRGAAETYSQRANAIRISGSAESNSWSF